MCIALTLEVGLFLSTNQGAWSRQEVFRFPHAFFNLLRTQQAFLVDQIQDAGTHL